MVEELNCPKRSDALLRKAEADLEAEACRRARVGVRDERLIDRPLKIPLHRQLLVYDIADVWSQLKVDLSIGNRTHIINFSLYGFAIGQ
jgi:hypothetical protein